METTKTKPPKTLDIESARPAAPSDDFFLRERPRVYQPAMPIMGKMLRVVGIAGCKSAGKSTLATALCNHICSKQPRTALVASFAHSLKMVSGEYFGVNQYLKKDEVNRYGMTNREWYQKFGAAMRAIHPDVWIHCLEDEISCFSVHVNTMLIDDVRYPNEVQWINKNGGFIIKLQRRPEFDAHESETSLEPINLGPGQSLVYDLILPDSSIQSTYGAAFGPVMRYLGLLES